MGRIGHLAVSVRLICWVVPQGAKRGFGTCPQADDEGAEITPPGSRSRPAGEVLPPDGAGGAARRGGLRYPEEAV